ncbi:hypothetical protein [Calothrix rhizosoleniae]|uniref:hypothetical protein n=1 Tax=Calothrix rhizosoleniae TaxID=888997 RepID=UPI001177A10B|nr:hypothetical protein [Calothrix rhizosoleniae]
MSSFHQIQQFLEQLTLSSYDLNLIDAYIGSNQLKLSSYNINLMDISAIDTDIGSNQLFEEVFNDNFDWEKEDSIREKNLLYKMQKFLEKLELNYDELNLNLELSFLDTDIKPNQTYREALYEYLNTLDEDRIREILSSWFPESLGVRI